MAVRTRDELIQSVNQIIGEEPDDNGLSLLEDISDTFATYADSEDWKAKYEENDSNWRRRYKERFQGVTEERFQGVTEEQEDPTTPVHFEDLFKEE